MANFKPAKIQRYNPESLGDIMELFVHKNGLSSGLACQAVFEAWDEASGAAGYTVNKFFRDKILYITVSSSVVRSQLMYQLPGILRRVNEILAGSETVRLSGLDVQVKMIKLH